MATFQYCAYRARGEFAEGRVEASSPQAALELLWSQGLTAFQVRPVHHAAEKWWQRDLFAGTGPSRAALPAFTREFATLMEAEIPLDDGLRILSDPTASADVCRLAADLRADVLNGSTLSDAMQKRPHIFPADYLS